jgi:hypothetical protein
VTSETLVVLPDFLVDVTAAHVSLSQLRRPSWDYAPFRRNIARTLDAVRTDR